MVKFIFIFIKQGIFSLFFYFFVPQNSAHNHPIPVQPSIQLAIRTSIISCLFFDVWRAIHAGAKITKISIAVAIRYFINNKKFIFVFIFIWGEIVFNIPPIFFIYHILLNCQVLLLYVVVGYILPFYRYETLNLFLFVQHLLQLLNLQWLYLRFRHCDVKLLHHI